MAAWAEFATSSARLNSVTVVFNCIHADEIKGGASLNELTPIEACAPPLCWAELVNMRIFYSSIDLLIIYRNVFP